MNIQPEAMAAASGKASDLVKALGNPHRLMILCQLVEQERSVGQLAAMIGLRGSTLSQHLALLRREGLVQPRRDGQTIWYSLASQPAREVLETLYRLFCVPPAEA
jgi:DNA-binding transcriptional ArsR family regulator